MEELSFGKWLKRRRRGLDLTQNELAHRAGYSGETLRKVEANALRPSRQMAEHLADHLAIAPAERAAFIRFARDELKDDAAPPSFPTGFPRPRPGLPIPPSELFGRETETAALRQLLLGDGVRLLSLLGAPGIGKTRLALHAAIQVEAAFSDGACFVELAPLTEPALVASELAQALGVREAGSQSIMDRLKNYLRDRQILLVLDNFEHLLAAAAQITELLAACPSVRVLVTSRAALHLTGEHEFEVSTLALPSLAPLPPVDALTHYPAVALYVQRTQAIMPRFRLTEANASAVAEICVHLDGLPLAIELAAARSKLFSPATLLTRLIERERLALLTGVARDRPAHQQTLRGTMDWSYNLLDPAAQSLFARLAVFAGGCTLKAAESVCGETPAIQERAGVPNHATRSDQLTLDELLGALVDQSLLRHADGPEGERRFWMLETLREYALERLVSSGEDEVLRRRHARHYLTLAESAELAARDIEQGFLLDRLAADHDNFRAALAWCLTVTDGIEFGLRIAHKLGILWILRSYYMEGEKWLAELLGRSQDVRSADRVECLIVASALRWRKYDYEGEAQLAYEAVALARQLGRPREISHALNRLVRPLTTCGDHAVARALSEESLALAREACDVGAEIDALRGLAIVARNEGNFAMASEHALQAMALVNRSGDRSVAGDIHYALGVDAWLQGWYTQAIERFNQGFDFSQERGDTRVAGILQWVLGCVRLDQGALALATEHFKQCLVCFRETDFRVGLCDYLLGMAGIATARGQAVAAVRLTSAANAQRAALGHRLEPYFVPHFDRQLFHARAQLDEETFAATWAAGQALTMEEAIIEGQTQQVAEP